MANEEQMQQDLLEFERSRQQLLGISSQKQQLQLQGATLSKALEVLDKTKEKKVYRAVGNILILSDVVDVSKETKEQKERIELRVKTLQKQEDSVLQKLNKLKAKIEGTQEEGETAAITEKPKAEKKK